MCYDNCSISKFLSIWLVCLTEFTAAQERTKTIITEGGQTLDKQHLLFERLKKYAHSDYYPYHMPGHKRRTGWDINPWQIDITEIDGFDNLHHPEGILRESMDWASSVYDSDQTYYLVNGSTCGILSAISATVPFGGKLIMSRNCHKSAYHGVILNHLKISTIYPQIVEKLWIQGGINPEIVDKSLNIHTDAQAVFIVSPTYDGIVSDVRTIAEIVHRRKIPLIVDEAHGAHFPFTSSLPSALDCGADIVIQSLHKTLPSLTQTAVLHVKSRYVDTERLERYLQIYQSSSPSYLLIGSIENCIYQAQKDGAEKWDLLYKKLNSFHQELSILNCLTIPTQDSLAGKDAVFHYDESKILISARNCFRKESNTENKQDIPHDKKSVDGMWLAAQLRNDYHLEMEMAAADYVLAIMTAYDTNEAFQRLRDSLFDLDRKLYRDNICEQWLLSQSRQIPTFSNATLQTGTDIADALNRKSEWIPLENCANRISSEFIYIYPPGIPVVLPGETITEPVLLQLLNYKHRGFPIQGPADINVNVLKVQKET